MLKNITSILISLLICANACARGPYIGANIGTKKLRFEPGYGDNLFEESLLLGNLFAGFKFNDYFGIEGGYENTIKNKRTSVLFMGDTNLGLKLLVNSAKYISKIQLYSKHLGIIGTYPINSLGTNNNISIICYIGIKKMTAKLSRDRIELNSQPSYDFIKLDQNCNKNIVMFYFGTESYINKHFTIRIVLGWENTAKIRPFSINPSANGQSITTAKLKNALSYGVGIILQ